MNLRQKHALARKTFFEHNEGMFDDWNEMDEDVQKKLKMVLIFGLALLLFLGLTLLLSDTFTGGARKPKDERSPTFQRSGSRQLE